MNPCLLCHVDEFYAGVMRRNATGGVLNIARDLLNRIVRTMSRKQDTTTEQYDRKTEQRVFLTASFTLVHGTPLQVLSPATSITVSRTSRVIIPLASEH